jgi:hypothetical protein
MSGYQIGDPDKLGVAVLRLVNMEDPPAHLLLGSDALSLLEEKLATYRAELDTWKSPTLSTDFADRSPGVGGGGPPRSGAGSEASRSAEKSSRSTDSNQG